MNKKNIYIVGVLLFSIASFSQVKNSKLTKGDKLYNNQAYFKSIEVYEKVANDGYKSVELFEKLGDSYFFNAEYINANKWYSELFKLSTAVEPIYYYRYSQTLKSIGDIGNAEVYLEKFSELSKLDSRSVQYANNTDYLSDIEDNSKYYEVEDAGINSAFSDYGTSVYNNKVFFTSSRTAEGLGSKKDNWTSDYFSSLYQADLFNENSLNGVNVFAKEIQTKYHESDPVFTKDGKTMFFTRNNDKTKSKSGKNVLLKIYKATLKDDKWSNVVELPFNNDTYSCAHPSISPDGRLLYFSSDMPGSYGESDIYKVDIDNENNVIGNPVNLGKNVNTQGKETFPWVSYDDKLYFASDGHLGLGGLDVFVTKIVGNDFTSKVVNAGEPINSKFDDFCFIQLQDSNTGFFTSNREGGKGKDDIYRFVEKFVGSNGEVVDFETNLPIPNGAVTIYDANHIIITKTYTDNMGNFLTSFDAKKGGVFYVMAESPEYETNEIQVNTKAVDLKKGIVVTLVKKKTYLDTGIDLALQLNIKDIFFDFNRSDIRPDATVELQKIVQVMKDFPQIKIAIGSHTDSRGSSKSNKSLSERRAQSTRAYLMSQGISGMRILAKGYGENKLKNRCSDDVECSEEEHQMNRRSEFVVVTN